MLRFRLPLAAAVATAAITLAAGPAAALERLVLRMPYLETEIAINLSGVQSAEELINSSPDLQDLQNASSGRLLDVLRKVFLAPLPVEAKAFLQGSTGQPLLEQALLLATDLVNFDGIEADSSGRMLTDALIRAEAKGEANILGFLREVPGQQASVDMLRVVDAANRLKANQELGVALVRKGTAAGVDPALQQPLQPTWSRQMLSVPVTHRPQPLRVLALVPKGAANGRLVVISHGLWDDPESFEGWGEVLAANGYTVLMPDHPGSDFNQQKAMLAGAAPPPGPEELRLRPLDVSALVDAVASRRLFASMALKTDAVAVVGHSWGATTSMQLAGAEPTDRKLKLRCSDLRDPERNLSWVLQCSWLSGIKQAGLADPRVKAVVAVSPPLRLLFDPSSAPALSAKVLLISGTRDWVVPSGPEAISPMRETGAAKFGHRLVLVEGANHFSLRSFRGDERPAVVGPAILAWVNEQLGLEGSIPFSDADWGNQDIRLVEVGQQL